MNYDLMRTIDRLFSKYPDGRIPFTTIEYVVMSQMFTTTQAIKEYLKSEVDAGRLSLVRGKQGGYKKT